jgi:putative ABC transport system permease protein
VSARFVLRHAGREARSSWRRFVVLVAAVALGVAALVAINSLTENVRESVRVRAQTLLGADVTVRHRRPLNEGRPGILVDSIASSPGVAERATVTFFGAMAYVPRTAGARTVNVTAIEGGFPFYGDVTTSPAGRWPLLGSGEPVALVDSTLLAALQARVGDTLALGEARFVVAGTVRNFPGDVGIGSAFSPRVVIPARFVESTELLRTGSRAQYAAYFRLAEPAAGSALAEQWRPRLRPAGLRVESAEENREDLGDAIARLTNFLGLVALVALLLGGIGVASAVHVFLRQKLDTIAVLRCLGASANDVLAVYLLQAALMGLAGSGLGVVLGIALQQALPGVLEGFLPVDVTVAMSWRSVAMGLFTGLWVALVFSFLPLLAVRRVPPLAALRRDVEPARAPRRGVGRWAVIAALAGSVVVLAAMQAGEWRTGLWFAAGIGAALGVLWLAAWLLVRAVRRWFPARWPYVWRQGLANLYRPANQTVTVVLALGFGAFLLATLLLVQHNLLRALALRGGPARPNLVLIDVQPDQRDSVEGTLRAEGLPITGPVPIVTMRIRSVEGRTVEAMLADDAAPRTGSSGSGEAERRPPGWVLRREYRSTYRDSIADTETIVSGEWWTRSRAGDGPASPVPVSIEAGIAADLGVGVGDEIVWDVQGVPVPSRIASVREVDWARFEPNFFFVFAPGALEEAPQTSVYLTRAEGPGTLGRVMRVLAERFPNVTSLDLTLVQATIETVVSRVVLAIRFMAFFSLGAGGLVLFGAVATSRFQRVREAVLLKTLGATRAQVARIVLAEYLALGLLASLVALGLAAAAGWALARFLFETGFAVPGTAFAGLAAAVTALTVGVGVGNSLEVLRRPPLAVLRES